jgi:hypothetical protein
MTDNTSNAQTNKIPNWVKLGLALFIGAGGSSVTSLFGIPTNYNAKKGYDTVTMDERFKTGTISVRTWSPYKFKISLQDGTHYCVETGLDGTIVDAY